MRIIFKTQSAWESQFGKQIHIKEKIQSNAIKHSKHSVMFIFTYSLHFMLGIAR